MILKPDMPDVSASSVKLEEVEVNTDAYKAQLVQQKAKRVEAAEALLSKANQDPKAVKKTHTKNARGRGRGGRGRGRGKTPNQDDQEPSATTADDEHKEGMGMSMLMKSQAKVMKGIPSPKTTEKVVRLMARRSTRERHSPMMS